MTKIWVAPESAIASLDVIVIAAYAHFELCRLSGVERIPLPSGKTPRGALAVEPVETFEVTTVISSSSMITSCVGEKIWVGSDAMLITENVSLHLNATLLPIAPNRHICGKTVLWRFLVAQLYP